MDLVLTLRIHSQRPTTNVSNLNPTPSSTLPPPPKSLKPSSAPPQPGSKCPPAAVATPTPPSDSAATTEHSSSTSETSGILSSMRTDLRALGRGIGWGIFTLRWISRDGRSRRGLVLELGLEDMLALEVRFLLLFSQRRFDVLPNKSSN